MAKIVRGGGSKSGASATASKPTKSGRRTAEEVAKLVPQFRKHLQAGGTMKELKKEHGFSDDGPIRAALYRAGYDSKGAAHGVEEECLSGLTPAKLRDKLVALRSEGTPWYALAYQSGKTEAEVKAIVADAGGPVERVYTKSEKPATEKPKKTSGGSRSKTAVKADPS